MYTNPSLSRSIYRQRGTQRDLVFGALSLGAILLVQCNWQSSINYVNGVGVAATARVVATGFLWREVLGALLGISGVIHIVLVRSEKREGRPPYYWLICVWLLWLALTTVVSTDGWLSIKRYILLLAILSSTIAVSRLQPRPLLLAIVTVVTIELLVGICAELSNGTFHPWEPSYRFAGLTHPNLQGAILSFGALAAFGLSIVNGRHRTLTRCLAGVLACGVLLTDSRTSIISLGVAVGVGSIAASLRHAGRLGRAAHIAIILTCIAGTTAILSTIPHFRSTLMGAVSEPRDSGGPEQLSGRVPLWNTCLTYARQRLLTGFGYDAFWTSARIQEVSAEEGWTINEAHSGYLEILLSSGLPAVIGFLILIVVGALIAFRGFWSERDVCIVWLMLFVYVGVHMITESIMVPVTFPAYCMLLAVWRVPIDARFPMQQHTVPSYDRQR